MAQLAEGPYTVPDFNETCKLSSEAEIHSKIITNVLCGASRKSVFGHFLCEP